MTTHASYRRPAPGQVRIEDGFWTPYLGKIHHTTAPYVFKKLEEVGYLNNFALVAGEGEGGFRGPSFSDGLLLESVRGACELLLAEPDEELLAIVERIVGVVARAAEKSDNGFLCTCTMLTHPDQRWGENGGDIILNHDLYDHGCLVEAGIAHWMVTGKTTLLAPAVRAANLIARTVPAMGVVPGHSLPEEAFVKLYCLFRDHRELDSLTAEWDVKPEEYLQTAQFWYDGRGRKPGSTSGRFSFGYNQNHLPFAAQKTAEGHSVRAALCYTGAAATAREAHRDDYLPALRAIWENITERKLHISGGIGTRHDIEGFDLDYNLPNDAYLETCAAIALTFFAGEYATLGPKSEYYDVFERSLYNNILAAIGEDFTHFFYQNPLTSDADVHRWDWHGCPCCPPMLLKLYGSLGSYIYLTGPDSLYVNLAIGSSWTTEDFAVSQQNGQITVDSHGKPMTLYVRIPAYGRNFRLYFGDVEAAYTTVDGYAAITRIWKNDVLTVAMDCEPCRIVTHPLVKQDRGLVAVMAGKWLYCAENVDNPNGIDVTLAADPAFVVEDENIRAKTADGGEVVLIPYYRWANRPEAHAMRVWFRQEGLMENDITDENWKGGLYNVYEKL